PFCSKRARMVPTRRRCTQSGFNRISVRSTSSDPLRCARPRRRGKLLPPAGHPLIVVTGVGEGGFHRTFTLYSLEAGRHLPNSSAESFHGLILLSSPSPTSPEEASHASPPSRVHA